MYQAAVIGLGGVGSFALNALSKCKGGNFLGVERLLMSGQSNESLSGKTQLFRRAYFEDERFVPWIERSIHAFKELGDRNKTKLLEECGVLQMGVEDRDHWDVLPPLLQLGQDAAKKHEIRTEIIRDVPDRFPQFRRYEGLVGLLEPEGGFIRPLDSIRLATKEALASSVIDIVDETFVTEWKDCGSFFDLHLETKGGAPLCVQTEKLVISAGSGMGELLPEWSKNFKVVRQLETWMDLSSFDEACRKSHHYDQLPGWVMDLPKFAKPVYGIPCYDEDWLVKIAIHERDYAVDPTILMSLEERKEAVAAAEDSMAVASRLDSHRQYISQPCLHTMTNDGHFCIGSPRPRIFAIGGLSDHGFRMAPALGQMMADFATGQDMTSWQFEFCSPNRP